MAYHYMMMMGGDPELFVTKNNKVVGCEKLIPKEGLFQGESAICAFNKVVRDGVQIELNPAPDTCRAFISNNIQSCFKQIAPMLKEGFNLSFSQAVEVEKDELDSLSPEARRLGCAPSLNTEKVEDTASLTQGKEITARSAGGHIHLGRSGSFDAPWYHRQSNILTEVLDVVVGNTCVMIDTNPLNATRRKLYGRAGEHRLPKHGYEYRTLSNFWLTHESLFSFVFGLTRLATAIVYDSESGDRKTNSVSKILQAVKLAEVKEAINTNNPELAKYNWEKVKPLIANEAEESYSHVLRSETLPAFEHFVKKGMSHWYDTDPASIISHWLSVPEGHQIGWEQFLKSKVLPDLNKH